MNVQICHKLHKKLKLVSCLSQNESFLHMSERLNGYSYCHNSCSKCPPSAHTHARRQPRHSSIAMSMTLWSMSMPNVQQTQLQFVNVVHPRLINSLLDDATYLVVDRIEFGAVRWPQTRGMKAGVACSGRRTVSRARCAGALSCWKMKNSPDTSRITCNRCCGRSRSRK